MVGTRRAARRCPGASRQPGQSACTRDAEVSRDGPARAYVWLRPRTGDQGPCRASGPLGWHVCLRDAGPGWMLEQGGRGAWASERPSSLPATVSSRCPEPSASRGRAPLAAGGSSCLRRCTLVVWRPGLRASVSLWVHGLSVPPSVTSGGGGQGKAMAWCSPGAGPRLGMAEPAGLFKAVDVFRPK